MKCSSWESWHLENDVMVPDTTCTNEVQYLLSNPPHWVDRPYCEKCAMWMMMARDGFNLPLQIKNISK